MRHAAGVGRVMAVNENGYHFRVRFRKHAGSAVAVLIAALTACSTDATPAERADAGGCPATPVDVVVSVDQWGQIVSELGGSCARVKTLVAGSAADPHDYEPSPADAAAFQGARLVVVNGAHYDEWATKLAASSAPDATVIAAASDDVPNPHVWYAPAAVTGLADKVTAELSRLAPEASDYFADRRAAFGEALGPYDAAVGAIRTGAAGRSYAATEPVFDDMAATLGLQDRTPAGYQAAARNGSDPAPADLDAFLQLLRKRGVDVLIYNTQTEGAVPQQVRSAAQAAGIPVVDVTETVAPGAESFEAWQVSQLTALAKALGVNV